MCKPAKVSQRAARKAAAACLARQRHKTFVQSLQEQANELHVRSAPPSGRSCSALHRKHSHQFRRSQAAQAGLRLPVA